MDIRPDRLALKPFKFSVNKARQVGSAALELVDSKRLAKRLQSQHNETELALATRELENGYRMGDQDLVRLQGLFCVRHIAKVLARSHPMDPLPRPDYTETLKKVMQQDLGGQYTLDSLRLAPSEIEAVRLHVPEF